MSGLPGDPIEQDSRERCASSDVKCALLQMLDDNIDRVGHGIYVLENRDGFDADLFIHQVRGLLAAMAAASSGKEKME